MGYPGGQIPHLIALTRLIAACRERRLPCTVTFQPAVALRERHRSQLATRFLRESQAEVLLAVEADIRFDPDAVLTLVDQAARTGTLVAAVDTWGNVTVASPNGLSASSSSNSLEPDPRPDAGIVAIHRRLLEAIRQREDMPLCEEAGAFPFFGPMLSLQDGQPTFVADIHAFAVRAGEAGFTTFVNRGVLAARISGLAPMDDIWKSQP
jgi:hypothetical protein